MSTVAPRRDLPTIEDETLPFWEAAKEHRLLIMACHTCGSVHHYPRPFCPDCWSAEVESQEASGRATLYTWSTVHMNDLPPFKERVPYVAAVVELVEGPRVMTNIVGCDEAELFIGMELEVAYQELTDAITVAVFQPARDSCVQG